MRTSFLLTIALVSLIGAGCSSSTTVNVNPTASPSPTPSTTPAPTPTSAIPEANQADVDLKFTGSVKPVADGTYPGMCLTALNSGVFIGSTGKGQAFQLTIPDAKFNLAVNVKGMGAGPLTIGSQAMVSLSYDQKGLFPKTTSPATVTLSPDRKTVTMKATLGGLKTDDVQVEATWRCKQAVTE